jgi:hypothetical protein
MSISDDNRKAIDAVLKRSATDHAFRKRLLEEPHKALADVLGTKVPAKLRIKFIEKSVELDALFVLPDPVTRELACEELDAVAGGEMAFWEPGPEE